MTGLDDSKIILVQPPIQDYYLTKKRTIPYGLAIIAADLRKHGFYPKIVDGLASAKARPVEPPDSFTYLEPFFNRKDISLFSLFSSYMHYGYSFQHIAALVRDEKPFVIGISSLFTAYADTALKTASAIKKFLPDCTVVMGGHHPTQFPLETLSHAAVDFVVMGEGEHIFAKLCTALKNNGRTCHIPGVMGSDAKKNSEKTAYWVDDLTKMPQPAFDLINHKFYRRYGRGTAIVVSSRGCPMRCSYCSVSSASSYARYRQRPVEDVVIEIKNQLDQSDIGFIDFEDENLCFNKKWFISLFSRLIPLLDGRNIELRAMNGLYPPSLDEKVISVLKNAGFKTLNLSLGTMNRDQLLQFKRPDIRPSYKNALRLAEQYDLDCVSYLIAAAPGQTAETSLKDLITLAQERTLIGLSIFYPAPGSSDFTMCKKKGALPEHFANMRSSAFPVEDTTTRLQAVTLLRLSRIINFLKTLTDKNLYPVHSKPCHGTGELPAAGRLQAFADRFEASVKLLEYFLHDGVIRGVHPSGEIFAHHCDTTLTRECLKHLEKINIHGVNASSSKA